METTSTVPRRTARALVACLLTGWVGGRAGAVPATRPTTGAAPTTAAAAALPAESLDLWPGGPPGRASGGGPERDDGTGRVWNVGVPGVLVYVPRGEQWRGEPLRGEPLRGHRTAVVVCPGGGYTHLTRPVGADGAVDALVPRGMVVVSLKYRLEPPSTDVEADARADVQRAVRLVRHRAADWGVDPRRVGVLGWSAGANVGLNAATRFHRVDAHAADPVDREDDRPDFVALLSPWPHGHGVAAYPVPADAPPAFVCSARDDRTAPVAFAQGVAAAFGRAGVPVRLWVVDAGGHAAFTIGNPGQGGRWVERFVPWLRAIGAYGR